MEEEVDILDADGQPTGKTASRSEAHRNGWCHPTIHVWLYTRNGKVLMQQRGPLKKTFPNLWDVSVAGHIGAGEEILEAAVREVNEEVGYALDPGKLEKVGIFKEVHRHRADFVDCEFHHTFIAPLEVSFASLRKEEDEVAQLALRSLVQVMEEAWGKARAVDYVPHDSTYYKNVFTAIKNRL